MRIKVAWTFFILFQSVLSIGCTCFGELTIKENFKKSDAVFVAKVIDKRKFIVDTLLSSTSYVWNIEYRLVLEVPIKGCFKKDTIKLVTGLGNGDCGFKFGLNKSYIIYAKKEKITYYENNEVVKRLHTNICTRTKLLQNEELEKLLKLQRKKYKQGVPPQKPTD